MDHGSFTELLDKLIWQKRRLIEGLCRYILSVKYWTNMDIVSIVPLASNQTFSLRTVDACMCDLHSYCPTNQTNHMTKYVHAIGLLEQSVGDKSQGLVRQSTWKFWPNLKLNDKVFFSFDYSSIGSQWTIPGGWHVATLEQFEIFKMAAIYVQKYIIVFNRMQIWHTLHQWCNLI